MNHSPGTWPTIPFHGQRLWETRTTWADMNPSQGVYDWSHLDKWLKEGREHKVAYMLTLALTPQWASSAPDDPQCNDAPGECDPPDDLTTDGLGTDQHWIDFLTAVVNHAAGRIKYWEIWNEPYEKFYWNGTYRQLVRMAQDARMVIQSIDPNARVLNGGVPAQHRFALKWWYGYAAAGGFNYADIIALHGDVRTFPEECGVYPQPENLINVAAALETVLLQYGQDEKPVWDTEASWGPTVNDCFNDQDLQAAFLARFYFMHRSLGFGRFYWRAWIDQDGGLYDFQNGIHKAGIAYGVIHYWLLGNTLITPCAALGTLWTCDFTGPDGYVGQAIWDTSKSCSDGVCDTGNQTVDPQFVDYVDLDGNTTQIEDNTVPVGAKPIWLENMQDQMRKLMSR